MKCVSQAPWENCCFSLSNPVCVCVCARVNSLCMVPHTYCSARTLMCISVQAIGIQHAFAERYEY